MVIRRAMPLPQTRSQQLLEQLETHLLTHIAGPVFSKQAPVLHVQ